MAYYIYSDKRHNDCIGMYDDNGNVYNDRAFVNGSTPGRHALAGCFDTRGYVYRDEQKYICVGKVDTDGKVYTDCSPYTGRTYYENLVGYVDDNGDVYETVGAFDNRPPSYDFPIAYVDGDSDARIAGAAALLLGLCGSVDVVEVPGGGASGSYGSGGVSESFAGDMLGLAQFAAMIAAGIFIILLLTGKVGEWREQKKLEEAREELRQEEIDKVRASRWQDLGDGRMYYPGYFGEVATTENKVFDFRYDEPKIITTEVTADPGLEIEVRLKCESKVGGWKVECANGATVDVAADWKYSIVVNRISGTGYCHINMHTMDGYEWETLSDSHQYHGGYFGEIPGEQEVYYPFRVNRAGNMRVEVTADRGLEIAPYFTVKTAREISQLPYENGETVRTDEYTSATVFVEHVSGSGKYHIDVYYE